MKPAANINRRPSFSIVMIGVLAVLLPLLAILQYQWIGQVSEAERDRLQRTVNFATVRSVRDVHDELERIVDEFRLRQRPFDQTPLETSAGVLAEDYEDWLVTSTNSALLKSLYLYSTSNDEYRRFDFSTGTLVPERPAIDEFSPWFADLEEIPESLLAGDVFSDGSLWVIAAVIAGRNGPQLRRTENWMLFEIDPEVLWSELVPEIIARRFEQTEYRVGVQNALTGEMLYRSDDNVSSLIMSEADARQPIAPTNRLFRLIGPELRMAAQHERGSLAEAVAAVRSRNLGIGFGILALLGASGALIIVWSERVRSVGRLQMEFAAGISHELRTPLATIRTAAHNIAAGVVKSPEEIREYAEIVQSEGRRLSAMVDQSIQFAQTEAGRRHYDLHPVAVDSVIERAVEIALPSADEGGNRIEILSHPALPAVLADETALRHCLVNLLTNAIKFGAPERPVTIDVQHDAANGQIHLSVHNEGAGIDVDELPHLFEPFYRGRDTAPIPGSGLGLSLVRRMMAGQKGRVTVESKPGKGATFVLHLPVAHTDLPETAKASV